MDCIICELAFGVEEINGVRKLKTFKGYTVDLRLQQFRKVTGSGHDMNIEFVDFASPEGQELLAHMHERAIDIANKQINQIRKGR
jgi:hypothetical protein